MQTRQVICIFKKHYSTAWKTGSVKEILNVPGLYHFPEQRWEGKIGCSLKGKHSEEIYQVKEKSVAEKKAPGKISPPPSPSVSRMVAGCNPESFHLPIFHEEVGKCFSVHEVEQSPTGSVNQRHAHSGRWKSMYMSIKNLSELF